MTTWRERMRPIIHRTIDECVGMGELVEPGSAALKEIRVVLRKKWDEGGMGSRSMHPYKVWLSEIRSQLQQRSPEGALARYQEMIEEQPDGEEIRFVFKEDFK